MQYGLRKFSVENTDLTIYCGIIGFSLGSISPPSPPLCAALVTSQHWFRCWPGAIRQQTITWTNVDKLVYAIIWHYRAPVGPEVKAPGLWKSNGALVKFCMRGQWTPPPPPPHHTPHPHPPPTPPSPPPPLKKWRIGNVFQCRDPSNFAWGPWKFKWWGHPWILNRKCPSLSSIHISASISQEVCHGPCFQIYMINDITSLGILSVEIRNNVWIRVANCCPHERVICCLFAELHNNKGNKYQNNTWVST